MKKYKRYTEDSYNIPSYMKFAGSKFKDYEQILFSSTIDFYLKYLLGNKKNSIKLRIVPKDNLMKGSFANVILNAEAMNNNIFTLNINRNSGTSIMLKYLAHEITHVAQIVDKRLSTEDFKTLQWDGKDIISDKEYTKLRRKDFDAYMGLPHEKDAEDNAKKLPSLFKNSNEFKNLYGINSTLDIILSSI